ncbi:glucuronate isomerase [Clostridium formicaceticum]|uniref:Uronate isomerase n=1 Tax=Clostridium formicaceticum TaxID=1497 RepID=A0AAC9RJI3_9CLOT|nr:glucuronate isomerase [Clostridium formicaceticum]AOY76071.1 glucuronate isomerase [Clostridium formicaceticum]ARE86433.1 Uronate isomerase [Clostridium formicaceticum]
MKKFMDENFLLNNSVAEELYHNYAKEMPIYDYHCHLSPEEIYHNKSYKNITEVWLGGDHYKWRAMRSNGIEEKYITGDADDFEKFMAWAKTVSICIGNPLYHWTHLELQRYFGIYDVLNESTAEVIWNKCNELLAKEDFTAKELIKRSNVKVVCTTDDPTDSLEYHIKIKEDKDFHVKVLPTFRPDKALNIEKEGFFDWLENLMTISNIKVESYTSYLEALNNRVDHFHKVGCRVSDHALDRVFYAETNLQEVETIFRKVLAKESLTLEEIHKFKTYTLQHFAKKYNEHGWAMQLHIGALRNNNTRMFHRLGPDTGYDSINDETIAIPLSRFLDGLSKEDELPKTILYCLNPNDNYILATMIGNFQGGGIAGKIQFGSGWWFNDQKEGMLSQMTALANLGLLSRFVGMLTDSRSFLSYPRHEYFRRILCNLIGQWVEEGEFPYDMENLGSIVKDICYNNAKKYFDIVLED